jgi:predicted aspartyl protease
MLLQRCALEQNKLFIPISITKPILQSDRFQAKFSQRQYRALIDTGAQRSVISRSIIAELGLMRTGHMQLASVHGPQTHSRYLASIALWTKRVDNNRDSVLFNDAELTLFSIENPFEIVDMQDNVNFDMIFGFDILRFFSFSYDAENQAFEIIVQR